MADGGIVFDFWGGNYRRGYYGCIFIFFLEVVIGFLGIIVLIGRVLKRKELVKLGYFLIIRSRR